MASLAGVTSSTPVLHFFQVHHTFTEKLKPFSQVHHFFIKELEHKIAEVGLDRALLSLDVINYSVDVLFPARNSCTRHSSNTVNPTACSSSMTILVRMWGCTKGQSSTVTRGYFGCSQV